MSCMVYVRWPVIAAYKHIIFLQCRKLYTLDMYICAYIYEVVLNCVHITKETSKWIYFEVYQVVCANL